jgi:hypothetical protein
VSTIEVDEEMIGRASGIPSKLEEEIVATPPILRFDECVLHQGVKPPPPVDRDDER